MYIYFFILPPLPSITTAVHGGCIVKYWFRFYDPYAVLLWHSGRKSTAVTPYAYPFFSCYLLPLKPFAYGTAAAIRFIRRSAYTLYDGRQQGVRRLWYDEQNDVKG